MSTSVNQEAQDLYERDEFVKMKEEKEVTSPTRWGLTAVLRYAAVVAGCIAFAAIYNQFGHGVRSMFMDWMFAIPLLAGCLVCLVLHAIGKHPSLPSRQLWALSIATFTVACCLRGVFEIAGTGSVWLYCYLVVGAALGVGAVILFALRSAQSAA